MASAALGGDDVKKTVLAVIIMLIFAASEALCFAEFENPPITDEAGYLTESQYKELSERLDKIRNTYSFDVAVYTEKTMSGTDAESCADDIFDYGGYGFGQNADGMILYISASPRKYHFSTHGSGEKFFNDNGLAYLENEILPSLKADDYYTAIKSYAEKSEELLEMARQGKPYNKRQHSTEYVLCIIGGALLLPLALAFIMMHSKLSKMKTAVEQNYAANYMMPGSMNVTASRDLFLYSTVIKTEKPKSNSGSHTSSSGESHGGRGGSF